MVSLAGQVALVTGASSGVGRALALALAQQGVHLCLVGRRLESLDAAMRDLRTPSLEVRALKPDLGLDRDIHRIALSVQQDLRRLDILVHSAGVISQGRLDSAPIEDLDWQYRVNLRAPYLLTQALLPLLRQCQGQVVFINSSAGSDARSGVGQNAATKYALRGVADSLREEVNGEGVRVLSIFLGRTATLMQQVVHGMESRAYDRTRLLQPEDVASTVINALMLQRTAEVTEIRIRPMKKTV